VNKTGQPSLHPADYVVMESTYGNRLHPTADYRPRLTGIIRETVRRGGSVIIPAFAVERTQKLLFVLRALMDAGSIPHVPVHVDSPMAIEAVKIFLRYAGDFDPDTRELLQRHGSPLHWPDVFFDKTPEQSKQAGASRHSVIIISASGMAEGGRVLHHLAQRLPDHRNAVVFVGFQAPGTRGQRLISGAPSVKIHGEEVPVRARVEAFEDFSDHADYEGILRWLETLPAAPRQVFLVHGEPEAARALEERIEKKLRWNVHVPSRQEKVILS
jgi:metallo-beta-lactamase family protein